MITIIIPVITIISIITSITIVTNIVLLLLLNMLPESGCEWLLGRCMMIAVADLAFLQKSARTLTPSLTGG